jgi:tetratricopeptide (TPR) repeat protein
MVLAPRVHAQSAPDPLTQHYEAARTALRRGDQSQAALEYRAFLAEAIHRAANARAQAGDVTAAARAFEEVLLLVGNDSNALLDYAAVLFDQGRFAQAAALVNRFVQAEPGNHKARLLLARALFESKDYAAARDQLEAITASGQLSEEWRILGMTYLRLQQPEPARSLFRKIIASHGDTPQTHLSIALAYYYGDYPDLAISELKSVIARAPSTRDAHYYLGLAYLGHNEEAGYDQALPEFRAQLQIAPKDFRSQYMLGYIALKQRNFARAEIELLRAASLNPRDSGAMLLLGQMYADTRRGAKAEEILRKLIASRDETAVPDSKIIRAHYILGRSLQERGEVEEGAKELKISQTLRAQLRSYSPATSEARTDDSSSLPQDHGADSVSPAVISRTPAERANALQFVAQISLGIADAYNNMGSISAGQKDFTAAAGYFQKASEWNPALEGVDRNLGFARFYLGNFAAAIAPLETCLRAHPDDTAVRSALGLSFFQTKNYGKVVEIARLLPSLTQIPQLGYAYAVSLAATDTKKRDDAVALLKQLVQQQPAYADAFYQLGKLQLEIGNVADATSSLESAARLQPGRDDVHYQLALAYRGAARTQEADSEMKLYQSLHKD